jgi:hypothetical protein
MGTSHNTLIAHLRNAETNHIGFSYNINTGDHNPDHGFMVSIKGYEETAPSGCDLIAFGRSYFLRHAEQLADPNYYMGCWVNAGRFVFDISENVQTKEVAIVLGQHHDQEAIWDCASGSEYRLMREGDEPARLVTIYYNDVFVSEEPNEISANCPYVNMPIAEATSYADRMIENGDWDAYCIPELCNHEVIFHEDDEPAEEDIFVKINQGLGLPTKEEGINAYSTEDFDAMLHTLDVAMDEFSQIYNHSASNDFREYYENHMTQLDNIINLINKLK